MSQGEEVTVIGFFLMNTASQILERKVMKGQFWEGGILAECFYWFGYDFGVLDVRPSLSSVSGM